LKPLVSVIIPTKNSKKTIELCINSVSKQSYQNIETIVVDSKSIDNTADISSKMGCKVISTDWKSLGARYEGLKIASGDFILLLDSDQILQQSSVERSILLSKKYDMLCFEEMPYSAKTLIEKMFQADRRLIHREFDIQNDPIVGALTPRFYAKDILERAFKYIPVDLFPFVHAGDDAILYYEAWKLSTKVGFLPDAVRHMEVNSIIQLWKKSFYYGRSTKKLLKAGSYNKFLKNKFRLRKTSAKMSKDKLLSSLLLMLKGPPYLVGLYL
jgi:glycosyltransferase involved in cell wall biosynthesis